MRAPYRITVARERYKFSCAHMTVFPDGRKERLHGHNYYLALAIDLADVSFAKMIDFAPIKDALATLCNEWKEHLLLASENPHFELVSESDVEIEFRLCGERYVIPRQDIVMLPIDNISVEGLASHATDKLLATLKPIIGAHVVGIEVRVEENPGQGASAYRSLLRET